MAKMYALTVRNRVAGAVLAVAILGLGAVLLTVGFALLLALVVAGAVLGTGVAIYRRLRGGRGPVRMNLDELISRSSTPGSGLDPTLEVKAIQPAIVRPRDSKD